MNKKNGRCGRILRIGIILEAAGIAVMLLFFANMQKDREQATLSGSVFPSGRESVSDGLVTVEGEELSGSEMISIGETAQADGDYIKWVDFNVTADAMRCALQYDLDTYGSEIHIDWIVLLAYAGCRGGGNFNAKSLSYIRDLAERMEPLRRLAHRHPQF